MKRLLASILIAASPTLAGAQGGPALVQVDAVTVERLSRTTNVVSRVVALRRGPVTAQVPAPVAELLVDVGDRVRAGAPLARLTDEQLVFTRQGAEAAVALAEASQERAEADGALAGQELARLSRLRNSAAFNQARFEDARQRAASANAEIARAAAERDQAASRLALAERDVRLAEITAPFAGVVIETHVEAGGYVTPGQPVVTLLDDAALEIEVPAPYDAVEDLTPGAAIAVTIPPGREIEARLRAALPVEDPLTRTRPLRLTAGWGDVRPAAGQSVVVALPVGGAREAPTVHKDGVLNGPNGPFVYVVEEGAAAIRPIGIGASIRDRFEVTSGLAPGDQVVIRGNEGLSPGRPVRAGDAGDGRS